MHHPDPERDRVVRIINLNRFSVNKNLARIGFVKAISDPHDRRFPRAVFPDNRVNRAFFDLHRNVVVGNDISESFCNIFKFEHFFQIFTTFFRNQFSILSIFQISASTFKESSMISASVVCKS